MTERSGETFNQAVQFVRAHRDWPYKKQMLRSVELQMPANLPQTEVISWFNEFPPQTGRGLAIYMRVLRAQKNSSLIKSVLSERWPYVQMGLVEQQSLRREFAGFFEKDYDFKRFDRLLYDGAITSANDIADNLGKGYRELAAARVALKNSAPGVDGAVSRVPASLKNDPGLIYERIKWRRQKGYNDGAIELLKQAPKTDYIYNQSDWWRERHIIVRRLIEEKKYTQAYDLASRHIQTEGFPELQAEWVSGFIAYSLLKNPEKALPHFQKLYERADASISLARGAYWAGNAELMSGHDNKALNWYKIAATHPHTYYGQAAAEKLQTPLTVSFDKRAGKPPTKSAQTMMRAVEILDKQGGDDIKRLFIGRLLSEYQDNDEVLIYLSKWAHKKGLRHEALQFAKKLAPHNVLIKEEGYPVDRDVLKQRQFVDPALLHALIRQESMFSPTIKSPAGALGLMQLMPGTARSVAHQYKISHQNAWLTSRPHHNIELGTLFFRDLLSRYKGSVPMALAAYNAGPSRVDRWIREIGDPRGGQISMEDWVELIPIYETRNYIQRIKESEFIYSKIIQ